MVCVPTFSRTSRLGLMAARLEPFERPQGLQETVASSASLGFFPYPELQTKASMLFPNATVHMPSR